MATAGHRGSQLVFAACAYLLALLPMVYFVGFLANLWVPKTIDGGAVPSPAIAILVDSALILSFALVHSLLARPWAKSKVVRVVAPELERSLYSAIAGAQFVLLIWSWQPLPYPLWSVAWTTARSAIWALYWSGWAIVVAGVFSLGTARLYGLAPAWERFLGRNPPDDALEIRGPYRWVRHPLYSGTILALWAAPEMSAGRALLATLFTIYILVGQQLEDRQLLALHGEPFARYRDSVGAYLPRLRRARADPR